MEAGRSAGEVWIEEAQIVPADETTVTTTVSTESFLHRVGATVNSVIKTPKDLETVKYWESEIARGRKFEASLHLDEFGNVIGADGRHRAVAALRSGQRRIHVKVTRRLG